MGDNGSVCRSWIRGGSAGCLVGRLVAGLGSSLSGSLSGKDTGSSHGGSASGSGISASGVVAESIRADVEFLETALKLV